MSKQETIFDLDQDDLFNNLQNEEEDEADEEIYDIKTTRSLSNFDDY